MPEVAQFPSETTDIDALFERLLRIDGKAEIVDGRIVIMSPTGAWPSLVALRIASALLQYEEEQGGGVACGDNATFRVQLPHRDSFSPDAAYYVGPPAQMGPFAGAPVFAVEVRSAGDYGPRALKLAAEKRDDYFSCGTSVVWDVDLLSADVVKVYRAEAPESPTVYRAGDIAEAEPAVPGWTMAVNEMLPEDWLPPSA
jgi:Uma2 family endonuclease